MNDIVFLLINGITVACIYGLVAVAVSITWSALGLLNLSYGFIFSFAGYGAWLAERHLWGEPIFVLTFSGSEIVKDVPRENLFQALLFNCEPRSA